MSRTDPLLSIGELARRARCSVKALRHYGKLGLLEPDQVDESSGYRYYRRSAARRAITIAMLRRLDLPLPAIRTLLDGGASDKDTVLTEERARLEREIAARRQALSAVERLLSEDALLPHVVEVEHLPALRLCAIELSVAIDEQEQATTEAVRALHRWAAESGLPVDPTLCLVRPSDDGGLALTVGLGVPGRLTSEHLPPSAVLQSLPAGPSMVTTHIGPYEQLGLAHHALLARVHELGHRELGPVREDYVTDPAKVPPDQLRTRVSIPIDPS